MAIQQMLLGAGAAEEEKYWFSELQDTSTYLKTNTEDGIGVDSDGNVYTSFRDDPPDDSAETVNLAKWNKKGALQWQKSVNLSTTNYRRGSLHVDGSNNIYLTGMGGNSAGDGMFIFKFASDGTLTWQRKLATDDKMYSYGMTSDSSGNIYVTGRLTFASASGDEHMFATKYNSSGTLQWCKHFTMSGGRVTDGQEIGVDSSDNVYIVGRIYCASCGGAWKAVLIKLNSSGAEQFNRVLTDSSEVLYGHGLTMDSSDNVYISTWSTGGGDKKLTIHKFNSSGTSQWQRKLYGTATNYNYLDDPGGLAVDSDDNIYAMRRVTRSNGHSSGQDRIGIFKYNSSGTIQWQRSYRMTDSGGSSGIGNEARFITTLGNHSIYFCLNSPETNDDNGYDLMVVKYPTDGSFTGTHGDFVIESMSYSDTAGGDSIGGESITYNSTTTSDSTTSYTVSNTSYGSATVDID